MLYLLKFVKKNPKGIPIKQLGNNYYFDFVVIRQLAARFRTLSWPIVCGRASHASLSSVHIPSFLECADPDQQPDQQIGWVKSPPLFAVNLTLNHKFTMDETIEILIIYCWKSVTNFTTQLILFYCWFQDEVADVSLSARKK